MKLPSRLSKQQQFILAMLGEPTTGRSGIGVTKLSRAVAREFDRLVDNKPKSHQEIIEEYNADLAAATSTEEIEKINERFALISQLRGMGGSSRLKDETVSYKHSPSFSRSLDRLEERGLIRRNRHRRSTFGHSRRTESVWPTEEGREVGEELRRRHADGRYSLRFNTAPWE